MIALLAGTTTSPERKFGSYAPPKDPEEIEAERVRGTQSYHGITQCSAKYRVCGICSVVGWRKDGLDAGMGTHYITLRTQLG